jgi:hypothetical protein
MDAEPMTIRMELRPEGELPTGRAIDERGRAMEFAGWIGLAAAIEDLLTHGRSLSEHGTR